MKIIREKIFEWKNIFSDKKVLKVYIDFEGYSETYTKDILNFHFNLLNIISQIEKCKSDKNVKDILLVNLKDVYNYIVEILENKFDLNNEVREVKKIDGEIYFISSKCEYENLTLEIYNLGSDLINSLIKNENINIEDRLKELKNLKIKETIEPSVKAIISRAIEKKMPIIKLGEGNFYQIGYGKNGRVLNNILEEKVESNLVKVIYDKLLLGEILKNQYIPIVGKRKIGNKNKMLKIASEIGYPVVLKNQYKSKINYVINNIEDENSLLKAYKTMCKRYDDVILEKHINGKSFRVCVVNYQVVGVALRIYPFVIGDGNQSLRKLIRDLNNNQLNKIKIDEELLNCIEKQEVTINSVISKGIKVYLRERATLLDGGLSEDFTDVISEENKEICEKTAKILGLNVCGIDIVMNDVSKSLNKQGAIIDITDNPDIIMHESPYKGKKRNISDAILNMMYENYIKNIPVLVTLGEGDTVIKGINYILSRMGYVVGAKSDNMLIIDGKCIDKKNNGENITAKSILLNRDIEIAILGTTKEEVVFNGLEYDLCDVAILKKDNKSNDLEQAESLVLDSIKDEGFLILNADEFNDLRMIKKIKSKKILFSINKENEILKENITLGNPVVYLDNEIIYVENNKKKYMICKIKDIPIMVNEYSEGRIQNVMAICAGLVGLKVDYCMIAKGLKTFQMN